MSKRNPVRWELPPGLSFDWDILASKSEKDFDVGTLKGYIDHLKSQSLKTVLSRVDKSSISPEELDRLVETEFQSLRKTHPYSFKQSVNIKINSLSEESWKALKEERLRNGVEHHRREYEDGRSLGLGILSPKLVPEGSTPVTLSAVTLSFDNSLLYRQKMLSLAQDFLTEDFLLNERSNPILTQVLNDVITGEPLYDFSVGELFELYGELVNCLAEDNKKRQLNAWIRPKGFKVKVESALLGESFTANYHSYSNKRFSAIAKPVPLPYAIRNTLAHQESSNPNVALLKSLPHGVHDSVVILRAIKNEYFGAR